ncbi:ABC transporter ATP-binding protein [Peribacillus sp. NPDC097264]|uniref:ABC transporter ATP-binding protein n=1 Tax=Peribacillus sp. NPDC097264 TaxID=3390616 RepID=UPI003CFC0007
MKSLRKLLPYLKPYTLFAILAPLCMCIEVAMDLLQPTMMQHIIDEGIANQDNVYVTKLGFLMLGAAVIGLIGGLGCTVYSTKAAVHFASDVRRDVFWKTELFSSKNTDSFGTGKLITIVTNDIASVQSSLMMTLRIFVRGPLMFIGSVIIVWVTARELFPILAVAVPVLMVAIIYFSSQAGKLFKRVQEAMDHVNTKLQETLSGIRVIKAYDRQEFEKESFKEFNDKLTKRNVAAEQTIMALMPILLFVINLGVVAGMWMGAIRVENGTMQVGVILAFINYLNIIMNGLMSSSHVLMQITRSFPSADRIQQVLDTEIDINEPSKPASVQARTGDVKFERVNYSYSKNGEYVIKDISFHARGGQKIGIIGSTGSGKSTLVKLIPRLYDPDTGTITIDGIPLQDYPLKSLRGEIGYIPQRASLFSGSIEENLRFGKEEAGTADMEAATQSAAALDFVKGFEGAFSYRLTQGANNLSGGQKQRLSIARAFIRKPRILILDDSTSAIDALSEAKVLQALKREFTDSTVFIVSSKISSIMDADQILVMDDGMIEAKGTHEELLAKSRVYQDIYRTQSGREIAPHE